MENENNTTPSLNTSLEMYRKAGSDASNMFGYSTSTGVITGALLFLIFRFTSLDLANADDQIVLMALATILVPAVNSFLFFAKKLYQYLMAKLEVK
jgi:hypothetical protein